MKYKTIVCDPPWSYRSNRVISRTSHDTVAAENQYKTMSNEEIAALRVPNIAEDVSYLYLWITTPKKFGDRNRRKKQPAPIDILEGWGFKYQTTIYWLKKPGALGMGFYFRGEVEECLFATRGGAKVPVELRVPNWMETDEPGLWLSAPKKRHSQKPEVFYDIVERVSPGPYLEMFARRNRFNWDTWGNEALEHVEIA